MSRLDTLFTEACNGDDEAFEAWMTRVEIPVWKSLAPYARAVDVEGVVQETLLRMWVFARDRGHTLTGENASLRFAMGMARNVARNEARRFRRELHLPPEKLPEPAVEPAPLPDAALARLIQDCMERLARRPRQALQARVEQGHELADRSLAEALGMTLNTFLQNIVRARKQLAGCLEEQGAPIEEML